MNRRKSNISPLIAARIRPARRPPRGVGPGGSTAALRIVQGDKAGDARPATPAPENNTAEIKELHRTADALRGADEALGRVHDRLAYLRGLLQAANKGRRRPPRSAAGLQQQIDSVLDSIDVIIDEAARDSAGRSLLGGEWGPGSASRTEVGSKRPSSTRGERGRTGEKKCAGFLEFLRSTGTKAASRAEPAEILAIVEANAAKIATQRQQLKALLSERVLPLLGTLEVTEENLNASKTAGQNADFVVSIGQISGAEALIHRLHIDGPGANQARAIYSSSARLSIHRDDEG